MRFLLSVFIVSVVFVPVSFSQTDDEQMILILKQSYRQSAVVANIELEKVEIDGEWRTGSNFVGYTIYRFTGKVVESFKGKYKKGGAIVFYSWIEGQPPPESLKRNFIRFLQIKKAETGQKQLVELENSGASINRKNLSMLRKLR